MDEVFIHPVSPSVIHPSRGELERILRHVRQIGHKQYELTDHLGNVRLTFADYKYRENYSLSRLKVLSKNDYYPFGMLVPDNYYQDGSTLARFGFNGMERDDEIAGLGNSYTAKFWQYDSRTARRWNQDPRPNPAISRYGTFALNPVMFSDVMGDTVTGKINNGAAEGTHEDFQNEYNKFKNYTKKVLQELKENGNSESEKAKKMQEMLVRLQEMENSEEVYFLDIFLDPFTEGKSEGQTSYKVIKRNGQNQLVLYMHINLHKEELRNNNRKFGIYAHELIHGSQYERRTIGIDGTHEAEYRTLGIEIEAYTMQFYYGGLKDITGKTVNSVNNIDENFVLSRGYSFLQGTTTAFPKALNEKQIQNMYQRNVENFIKLLELYMQDSMDNWKYIQFKNAGMFYYRGWRQDMIDRFSRDF